ncbi:High affinity copper uptake protein 1 [Strongyloides ratti]|uniref:Copper transport protein n=1 Tax=Strongyloides ratti TaxID=34506 RepID=A0A090KP59_STRRB|nr:High affinity copper uptake protein 1 [Strongyloides ratti]CEF59388.1 High affinity copper uptake protein 1 [Strongyloides ratti]
MNMLLHFGTKEFILFEFWKTGSFSGIFGSMIIVFLIAFLYEGIRKARIWMAKYELKNKNMESNQESFDQPLTPDVRANANISVPNNTISQFSFTKFPLDRFIHALLYGLQTTISFTLMLIIMTFNGWIIISAIFGMTIGYFTFNKSPLEEMSLGTCC